MLAGLRYGTFATLVVAVISGCGGGTTATQSESTKTGPAAAAPATYLLTNEPEGAVEVCAFREEANDGDDVVVVGRIGGDVDPWVADLVAFNIVDTSLKPCLEDGCDTPWDYCCEPDLAESRVLVKVVDEEGRILDGGAKGLLGVEELETVVVQGKAKLNNSGNVSLLATGVFVRK